MTYNSRKGFSLIEMVVSVAIFAVISIVLSQVFISTLRTNTKTEIVKEVKQNGELALEHMGRFIQSANSIISPCTTTGTTSQSITIVNEDNGQTTFECSQDGTVTRLASVSAQGTEYLTSTDVTLGGTSCADSSLWFTCYLSYGLPGSVTLSFQLAQSGEAIGVFEQSSELFQTTATMRNVQN